MAYYDEKKKDLTAKEIADRFSVGYYEIQIDKIESRISSIISGDGDVCNGVTYMSADSLRTPKERQRRIEHLRRKIEDYKKMISEINEAIRSIDHGIYVLEKAAESNALIGALSDSLRKCFRKYQTVGQERVAIPSSTYDAIFVNKLFEDFKSKYRRLWSKEYNKANRQTRKIKKDIYKKLKKVETKNIVEEEKYRYGYSRDEYDYTSLKGALIDNHHSLKGFASELYSNISSKYYSSDMEALSSIGVEVHKLKRAYEISDGAERLFDDFGQMVQSMDYLAKEYNVSSRFRTFYILKEKVEEVEKLSREVECLDLIIDAFDNTVIKDSDLFIELKEIYRKQNKKLNDLSKKVKEMYERSGIKEYVETESKLRELAHKSGSLKYQVSVSEQKNGYSHSETRQLSDMYYGVRSEMLSILLKYPELNKPEYGIDLSKYDKKGRYIGKDEPSKSFIEDEVVPTVVVTDDEIGKRNDEYQVETPSRDEPSKSTVEENNEIDKSVLERYSTVRTAYYSRYMVEKVKNSELGKMTFSEYLEEVAPELEELIKFEQQRERKAANVFKQYIQYLASLENKENAMRFSDFARIRYDLSEDDLPFEYTDDEVKKRLK